MSTFPSVDVSFKTIDCKKKMLLQKMCLAFPAGSPMHFIHLIYAGVCDRTLSNISGFMLLVEDDNFLCAATILRMQIDTAMRLNAFYCVENSNDLAEEIFKGNRFGDICDKDNKKMKDWYLRKKLEVKYPWVKRVYEESSGAVHLSNRHIFMAAKTGNAGEDILELNITGRSDRLPDDYSELVAAFDASLEMTCELLFPDENWGAC